MSRSISCRWSKIHGGISADTEPLDIGESDLKLIRALEANPREEINSLAKKAGLGRKTAARRLQKLLDDDIVSIVSITDPTAMGFSVHALIFLKVRLDKLPSVANILTAHEKITHVVILGGAYNMLVAAAFENLGEMSRFLLSELGEMAGVIERETMIHIGRPEWSVRLMEALDYE